MDIRLSIFEPSFVQSRQFQILAPLTIMPAQHMNPVDQNQLLKLALKSDFRGGLFGCR